MKPNITIIPTLSSIIIIKWIMHVTCSFRFHSSMFSFRGWLFLKSSENIFHKAFIYCKIKHEPFGRKIWIWSRGEDHESRIFDLDDTLLWDEKASEQHLQKLVYRQRKSMALTRKHSKQLFAKRRENCTCLMRRIHIQWWSALTRLKDCGPISQSRSVKAFRSWTRLCRSTEETHGQTDWKRLASMIRHTANI